MKKIKFIEEATGDGCAGMKYGCEGPFDPADLECLQCEEDAMKALEETYTMGQNEN